MSKLWCIALAFGDDEKRSLVSSTYIAPTSEMAVAMVVSQFYTDNPSVRMPLRMIATHELTREYLDKAIAAMDEDEAKPPSVVRLVPKTYGNSELQQEVSLEQQRRLERMALGLLPDEPAA